MDLQSFFESNPAVALGFSGGVDSSYLLYAGVRYGADIKPYFVKTAFQPEFELADARRVAGYVGAEITVLPVDVLAEPVIASNPVDRCYHCKRAIFGVLAERASAEGRVLIDGSNASDDAGDRPGMRALSELGVRSPLRECGLTKADVRRLSKDAGLFTWDKPAYACLATRVPVGRTITGELLNRVERAENALFSMGFSDFRVRVQGTTARLQFTLEQMPEAFSKREAVIAAIKPYFTEVLLDLEGRGL